MALEIRLSEVGISKSNCTYGLLLGNTPNEWKTHFEFSRSYFLKKKNGIT